MVDTHVIIHIVPDHVKPDTIDSFILLLGKAYVQDGDETEGE